MRVFQSSKVCSLVGNNEDDFHNIPSGCNNLSIQFAALRPFTEQRETKKSVIQIQADRFANTNSRRLIYA